MSEITRILGAIEQGDRDDASEEVRVRGQLAVKELLPLVYDELRKLAVLRLTQEKPGQTLEATALVHEAYIRLVDEENVQHWNSRGHFFAAAAEAMRRILIERARHKHSLKAGGNRRRLDIAGIEAGELSANEDLLALNEALEQLTKASPRKAELVKLRFFAGLTIDQAAQALGISASTADNDWAYARCWLRLAMEGSSREPPS